MSGTNTTNKEKADNEKGEEILESIGITKPDFSKIEVEEETKVDKVKDELEIKINKYYKAGIKSMFINDIFENYICETDNQAKIKSFLMDFSTKPKKRPVVHCLVGKRNTGKNHLATATAKGFIDSGFNVKLTKFSKVIRAFKDNWNTKGKEQDILDSFIKPDFLIIDEIGRQRGTETELLLIEEIIDDRYEDMKPTLLIGNVNNPSEMKDFIGERSFSRFERTGSELLICDWESYRK